MKQLFGITITILFLFLTIDASTQTYTWQWNDSLEVYQTTTYKAKHLNIDKHKGDTDQQYIEIKLFNHTQLYTCKDGYDPVYPDLLVKECWCGSIKDTGPDVVLYLANPDEPVMVFTEYDETKSLYRNVISLQLIK